MNPLFILSLLLAASGVLNLLQWSWSGEAEALHKAEISHMDAKAADDAAVFTTEAYKRYASLSKSNKEIQDDLTELQLHTAKLAQDLAQSDIELAVSQRVRDDLKKQFPAAVERATAGALRSYSQRAEGDIEFAEDGLVQARRDTAKYGGEAVSAAAASSAYRSTLQARRRVLEEQVKRATGQVSTPEKSPEPSTK